MHIRTRALAALAAVVVVTSAWLPAGAAASGGLRVDAVGYVPAAYDPAIPEHPRKDDKNWDFGNPDLGGILSIVVANDGAADAAVSGVTVDGMPLADFLAGTCQDAGLACTATPPREIAWARWLPEPVIPAGGAAVFQLKRTTAPASTTIGIDAGGHHLDVSPALEGSPIRLGAAYRDGADAVVIVRNDGSAAVQLTSVRLNGAAVTPAVLGGSSSIAPHRTAILRLAGAAPADGTYAALAVATSGGTAVAGVRLYEPYFPIGNWLSGSSWSNDAFMDDVEAHHIDTSWGYWDTVDKIVDRNIKLIADAVPCAPGQTSGCISEEDEKHIAAYAYGDEVEFGHAAQEVAGQLELRRQRSTRPTYINDAAQRLFQAYAGQADIGSMDHYTSGIGLCTITTAQPSSMQGQPVEWAGNYTRQLKLNVEPNPAWTWSQAANWQQSSRSCWHGTPTIGEMQAQVYSELANGSKGITWFIFNRPELVAESPELWAEAGNLGATLVETRGWLSTGDLDPGALVASAPGLEVGVVSAPDAVVASILDLDYRSKPKGYEWATRTDVGVSIALPTWLANTGDLSVTQVRDGASSPVPFTRAGDVVTATIPSLNVGTLLVIEPAP
jgi:hypothetical protein